MYNDPYLTLLLFLLIYLLTLVIIKSFNIFRKKTSKRFHLLCPGCKQNAIKRIKRKSHDMYLNIMTLQLFKFKRYKCTICTWEGLRW